MLLKIQLLCSPSRKFYPLCINPVYWTQEFSQRIPFFSFWAHIFCPATIFIYFLTVFAIVVWALPVLVMGCQEQLFDDLIVLCSILNLGKSFTHEITILGILDYLGFSLLTVV